MNKTIGKEELLSFNKFPLRYRIFRRRKNEFSDRNEEFRGQGYEQERDSAIKCPIVTV